jgi:hypothetical protein
MSFSLCVKQLTTPPLGGTLPAERLLSINEPYPGLSQDLIDFLKR